MKNNTLELPESQIQEIQYHAEGLLDRIAREGARQLLMMAMEKEVEEYTQRHANLVDEDNKRLVVRNGYLPEREILAGAGRLKVKQPRVDDRREGKHFTSAILPPYARKSATVEALIPCLYLRGISTNDFTEALSAILGSNCPGLTRSSISDLVKKWQDEYQTWQERSLKGRRYVYWWADGVHLKVRLGENKKTSLLVIMGATEDGRKEIVGIFSGYRESTESWAHLLRDLKSRGLEEGPRLAMADGALGFWNAISEVFPETKQQRCWVHKTANVLDKMPKCVQEPAKSDIHNIYLSDTKENALKAYDDFIRIYEAKYPNAVKCLEKSKDELFAFFDFPAEHWRHIRTTNIIESIFSTVKHRTRQTKGAGSKSAAEAMAWKICIEGEKRWKRLNGFHQIPKIYQGVKFINGEELKDNQQAVS